MICPLHGEGIDVQVEARFPPTPVAERREHATNLLRQYEPPLAEAVPLLYILYAFYLSSIELRETRSAIKSAHTMTKTASHHAEMVCVSAYYVQHFLHDKFKIWLKAKSCELPCT